MPLNAKELRDLGRGPYAIALNALSRIAFGFGGTCNALDMQRVAFDAFVAATEPCPHCGGIECKVDACPHCDHTGRLPRCPFAQILP